MMHVTSVTKTFGGLTALCDVSIDLPQQKIIGLVGPNGSGKSTLFAVISGFLEADTGQVSLKGHEICGERPEVIARMGLCRTFQLQPDTKFLTVEESILASFPKQSASLFDALFRRGSIRRQEAVLRDKARQLLEEFEIAHIADEYCGSISGGQQKLLAIARAMATGAEVILLDEPAAGVNPVLRDRIAGMLRQMRDVHGKTILLVEHDMRFVGQVCDDIYVLDAGKLIASGNYETIRTNPAVLEAYLGRARDLR